MPVVLADPLVPPAICWLILVIETGADAAPTLSVAVTPVGALSSPESSVGLRHREREGDQSAARSRLRKRSRSATATDCGHDTADTTAVKSWPSQSPVSGSGGLRSAGTALASATDPGARTTAGVAAAAGPANQAQPITTRQPSTRRCHADQRAEREVAPLHTNVLTQHGSASAPGPSLLDVRGPGRVAGRRGGLRPPAGGRAARSHS